MYISKNWLSDYIDMPTELSASDLEKLLTMHTAEVEGYKEIYDPNIVVGKINKILPHKNADKLKIVYVQDGQNEYKVVCGGQNLKEDMFVIFAKIGAKVRWHGEGDYIILQKAKIRDEESFGMICASAEVDIPIEYKDSDITDLSEYVNEKDLGKNIYDVLDIKDVIYEIENKSITHRADLFGHYGIARDLKTSINFHYGKNLKLKPYTNMIDFSKFSKLNFKVNTDKCLRYSAILLDNLHIGSSTLKIRDRLIKSNIKPINNIVDLSNYIMLDLGQPMHAFDKNKIKGNINVNLAGKEKEFIALDDKTYKISPQTITIEDEKNIIALGGIIGGQNSEIDNNTKSLILESATFDFISIRYARQYINLMTDAQQRFEKFLDINYTTLALSKFINILSNQNKDIKIGGFFDHINYKSNKKPIHLPKKKLYIYLGDSIKDKTVENILNDLDMKVETKKDEFIITPPTCRINKDIEIKEDIIEEIARIIGFTNLQTNTLVPKQEINYLPPERQLQYVCRDYLVLRENYSETINYIHMALDDIERFDIDKKSLVKIKNPISKLHPVLRNTLLPGLLLNIKNNIRDYKNVRFFEIGKIFHLDKADKFEEIHEKKYVGFASQNTNLDFYKFKNSIINLLLELNIKDVELKQTQKNHFFAKYEWADIYVQDTYIGQFGKLHKKFYSQYDISEDNVYLCEMDIMLLVKLQDDNLSKLYSEQSKFPEVYRDLCLVMDKSIEALQCIKIIQKNPFVLNVQGKDVYLSDTKLGKDKKSLTFTITFNSNEKTLSDTDVNIQVDDILKNLEKEKIYLRLE